MQPLVQRPHYGWQAQLHAHMIQSATERRIDDEAVEVPVEQALDRTRQVWKVADIGDVGRCLQAAKGCGRKVNRHERDAELFTSDARAEREGRAHDNRVSLLVQ